MVDVELLAAIGKMMDEKLEQKLEPINKRLEAIEERLEAIEEKQELMNEAIGTILEWSDDVSETKDFPLPRIM